MRPPHGLGFPPAVQEVFDALRREVTTLHASWEAFQQLFGNAESVAALNETAPGAFALIRHNFRHEFVMAFSRITDPKATGPKKNPKENLTLKQLLHVIGEHCIDAAFIGQLTAMEHAIDAHCQPIRDVRNRSVGHLDLQTALSYHPDPLPNVDSRHFTEALRLLAEFMNEILGYYRSAYVDFVPVVSGPARNIVDGLREFQRLRKKEHQEQIAELQAEQR